MNDAPPQEDDNATTILKELDKLGVQILEPSSKKEISFANALDAFSHFVLCEEPQKCQSIIDKHVQHGSGGAGILQGGSDEYDIYRITILDDANNDDEDDENVPNTTNASLELMREFLMSHQGKHYKSILTIDKLKSYMLGMCDRRTNQNSYEYEHNYDDECGQCPPRYTKLGNLMYILSFGPTNGQVRHIDDMSGNVQICLYMSDHCETTLVYALDGPPITNVQELVDYWNSIAKEEGSEGVPDLLDQILTSYQHVPLAELRSTQYFSHLGSLQSNLERFGKLYRPVSQTLGLVSTDPGTTLLAGGNEVHAGPPTKGPRMFAFAIGIPDKEDPQHPEKGDPDGSSEEDNDGEVQYSPVLFHIDMCCILFGIMMYEFEFPLEEERTTREQQKQQQRRQYTTVKRFLLGKLLDLLQEYPTESYTVHFGDNRKEVGEWIEKMVHALSSSNNSKNTTTATIATAAIGGMVESYLQQAMESETMFYDPHIAKLLKKKKRQTKNRTTRKRTNKQ